MTAQLIELDDRFRGSLRKVAKHHRYLVEEEPGGVLIFRPAVVLTEDELAYERNTELSASIEAARRAPENRRQRPPRTP
ncbi:hypothetical protein [Paenarthrobacter histidinolovorans]|uniref:Antitoxin n=1 Tax=Paenarthrobacter histidinolovorans TaxID=43664 RepID=A0ABW8N4C0_9MICC